MKKLIGQALDRDQARDVYVTESCGSQWGYGASAHSRREESALAVISVHPATTVKHVQHEFQLRTFLFKKSRLMHRSGAKFRLPAQIIIKLPVKLKTASDATYRLTSTGHRA